MPQEHILTSHVSTYPYPRREVARAPASTLQWNPLGVPQAEPSRAYSEFR
jgi:hypothetical protein